MNGISLGEFAAVLTALGAILGSIFLWTKNSADAQAKVHEGRVSDLQKAFEELRKDHDERIAELRKDHDERIAEMRADFDRQITDMKAAMTHQAQIVQRQEIMLSDYARHVGKLERIMASANLEIPDFETSPFRGV